VNFYKTFLSVCLLSFATHSIANSEIDDIMSEYNQKNRFSSKTIDENKGNLVLYTREDIERMHATRLRDIFKTIPIVYYHENRYALPDPFTSGMFEPYRSSFIRIYIDGVEVTQGWAGSGVVIYGDINIDFVDHIEFYYTTPSYESSSESAYVTIFMYSKDPVSDGDATIKLTQGSRGYNEQSVSVGDKIGDVSYMINLAHTDAKREKIDNGTSAPLSRDFEENQLFAYIKDDREFFHLQIIDKKTDSFAGASWDATPLESSMDYLNVHLDYGIDINQHFKFVLAYDWFKTNFDHEDDYPLMSAIAMGAKTLHGYSINDTFTAELTYKQTFDNHHILAGIKDRYKHLQSVKLDGNSAIEPDFDLEHIISLFVQDQYILDDHNLLSASISYNYINRNGGVSDDDLYHFRLGYIYNNNQDTFKVYLFRTQFAVEPMMRSFNFSNYYDIEPQTSYGISAEYHYQELYKQIRVGAIYMQDKDSLLKLGLSDNSKDTRYFISYIDGEYQFDTDNKIAFRIYNSHYKNIYNYDSLDDISVYLSFFNRFGKFDFYNGFVYHKNSLDWKSYIDWTSTISMDINENLTITLKGDNILDRAKETNIFRFDPSKTPEIMMEPLHVSPIDRMFSINVEYRF
jgi:iron complex outermembrane receptor protein